MNYARRKWRNAVDLHHLPVGTHSLAPKPGSLARLAFQKWSTWQDLHLQPSHLERDASANWATRGVDTLVLPVGFAPTLNGV